MFLCLRVNKLHINTSDEERRGKKGNRGKIKKTSDMQRGYAIKNKGEKSKYGGNVEPYWFISIQ